jgi:hypothetical protein
VCFVKSLINTEPIVNYFTKTKNLPRGCVTVVTLAHCNTYPASLQNRWNCLATDLRSGSMRSGDCLKRYE